MKSPIQNLLLGLLLLAAPSVLVNAQEEDAVDHSDHDMGTTATEGETAEHSGHDISGGVTVGEAATTPEEIEVFEDEGPPDIYCLTLHEDLVRRQADEWGSTGPFTIDDGTKHTPFVSFDASTRQATVIIGNGDDVGGIYHPMVASDNPTTVHFITYVYVVDQNNHLFAVKTMDPNVPAPATVVFDVPLQVTEIQAYEFCNLHGLWKGPSVSTVVDALAGSDPIIADMDNSTAAVVDTSPSLARNAGNDLHLRMCHIDSPLDNSYGSFAADFVRRQSLPPFNSLTPYDEDDGAKHTPYTSLNEPLANGTITATVTVGTEGNYHVMFGASSVMADDGYEDSGGSSEPHWITDVYVVDQHGDIITMQSLNPTDMDIAQITFAIPPNTTTLTAYVSRHLCWVDCDNFFSDFSLRCSSILHMFFLFMSLVL